MLNVTFFGVRGSTAAAPGSTRRYGTHTCCVTLEVPKRDPIVCDLGTGLLPWAATVDGIPRRASVLLTDTHLGHLLGLAAVDGLGLDEASLEVYGPPTASRRLADAVNECLGLGEVNRSRSQPLPVRRFTSVEDEHFTVGNATVKVRSVPHTTAANGYRIDWDGVRVAYISDHQAPSDLATVDQNVLELADGVDLLVHDAQLSSADWESRSASGHSTVDYAVFVARQAGARCLALFHHDPLATDAHLDRVLAGAQRSAERLGVDEVIAAAEGTTISFERCEPVPSGHPGGP